MANDIRRQTVLDLTNALTSMTRQLRVLNENPRAVDKTDPIFPYEMAARDSLTAAIRASTDARSSLESLDAV